MNLHALNLRRTGQFPDLLLDYLDQSPALSSYYTTFPSVEQASSQIALRKSFDTQRRETLVEVLKEQYAGLPQPPAIEQLLEPTTFTVTTGHQLSIFTGPLFVIYKIVTTIALARKLQEAYPDYTFVPVYWMASEDHDFEEIASFRFKGQKYTWQTEAKGAVGRLDPRSLADVLAQLPEKLPLFENAYLGHSTLADAVRHYMHELFGEHGLVCLDADDARLKRHFLPVMQVELFGESATKTVEEHTASLQAMGYQTPISAREINLFYLTDSLRERIVKQDNVYEVLNSPQRFSEEELRSQTESNPERFSPNVVLRPLYQETILPNLAYVGGPSELPYWLQLKGVFEQHSVPFPMLLPRNFALYVPTATRKRIEKLGLDYGELFTNRTTLRKQFVARLTAHRLTMDTEKAEYASLFDALVERIAAIDPTLVASAKAEQAKLYNRFDTLEKRLQKAEERKYSTQLTQLDTVLDVLFPNGTPQERSTNFLEYYLENRLFIAQLLETLDPLDFRFMILEA